jgi:hypothetical protein
MKTLPFTLSSAKGLPALITITRGLTVYRFTTYEASVTIAGNTWVSAPGANITNITTPSDGSPTTADVTIMAVAGGLVLPGECAIGKFDNWPITIEIFDSGNPALGTVDWIPGATIGNANEDSNGLVTFSVNGPLNQARGPLTEHYSLTCRADLGDNRCKIPIMGHETIGHFDIGRGQTFVRPDIATGLLAVGDAYGRFKTGVAGNIDDYANVYFECTTAGVTDATTAPAYDATIGNSTTDGSATFICRNGWLRHARGQAIGDFTIQLTALPDSRASDSTWYVNGAVFFRSGTYSGFPRVPIRAWDPSTYKVTTFLPLSQTDIPANTQIEIYPGCDLTREMCFSRFNNIVNMRAETFVPPSNFIGI